MTNPVCCPHCNTQIGTLTTLSNGQEWLKVGTVIVRSLHGVCTCGQPFHWTVAESMLAELVAGVLQLRIDSDVYP